MLVKFDKSNVYTIENFYKASTSTLRVEGSINCDGSLVITGGTNVVTLPSSNKAFSMSIRGSAILRNGTSNKSIYHKGTLSMSNWNNEEYVPISFNNLPAMQDSSDLVGFLAYLKSLDVSGVNTVSGSTFTLKGKRTKSINVFEVTAGSVFSGKSINVSTPSTAPSLLKLTSDENSTVMNSVTIDSTTNGSKLIIAVDTKSLTMNNCTFKGTLYAPNSDVTLNSCVIDGAVYAKSITCNGDVTIKESLLDIQFEDADAPTIKVAPVSSIGNYSAVTVSILPTDVAVIPDYYEIRYTIDGSDPTKESNLYTGEFELLGLGIVTVKAKLFGDGVLDGGSASQAYGFNCKTSKPHLTKSVVDDVTTYLIIHSDDSKVYYTLDGSVPTINATEYNSSTFNLNFSVEGRFELRFIAVSANCDDSDEVYEEIFVALPRKWLLPPSVSIWKMLNGSKAYKIADVNLSSLSGLVEVPNRYLVDDANEIAVFLTDVNSISGSSVMCSVDGSTHTKYTPETPIYIRDISDSLRAFSHVDFVEYSKQINYTFLINTTNSLSFDLSAKTEKSDEVRDALQGGQSYAVDIAWVGPGVVTDDFAVYQALINILATQVFERVFNPKFGVTISSKIGSIDTDTDTTKLISELKFEIESQDSRIKVDEYRTDIYYDERVNGIVVDLVWTNLRTNNSASVKYAYDLDTIV